MVSLETLMILSQLYGKETFGSRRISSKPLVPRNSLKLEKLTLNMDFSSLVVSQTSLKTRVVNSGFFNQMLKEMRAQ
jgi:hypothetical protein